jgi:hypothetical protein
VVHVAAEAAAPDPVVTRRPGANPQASLNRLARTLSRTVLARGGTVEARTAAEQVLHDCVRRAVSVILEVEAFNFAPVVGDACRVARLGVLEAANALEHRDPARNVDAGLKLARHKLYLALMTIRHTLRRVESQTTPLWHTLSPALAIRRALAIFRDSLGPAEEASELGWHLLVAQGELGLLLADPSLGALSNPLRSALTDFAAALRDPSAREAEIERIRVVVDEALAETNDRAELRANDERVLRELLVRLTRSRDDEGLQADAEQLMRAVWGLDPELDRLTAQADGGDAVPWCLVLAAASDTLAGRFGGAWVSGAPPRW